MRCGEHVTWLIFPLSHLTQLVGHGGYAMSVNRPMGHARHTFSSLSRYVPCLQSIVGRSDGAGEGTGLGRGVGRGVGGSDGAGEGIGLGRGEGRGVGGGDGTGEGIGLGRDVGADVVGSGVGAQLTPRSSLPVVTAQSETPLESAWT